MVTDCEGTGAVAGVESDVVEDATRAAAESYEGLEGDCIPEGVSGEVANYHARSMRLGTGELPGATRGGC